MNSSILKILKDEGYILDYRKEVVGNVPFFVVKLKYYEKTPVISDIVRISKSGCRRYSKTHETKTLLKHIMDLVFLLYLRPKV